MNFYDRWVLPPVLDLVTRQCQLGKYRRVVAAASGRVLEVGVASGLNFALYSKQIEIIFGIDPSPRLLAIARRHQFVAEAERERRAFHETTEAWEKSMTGTSNVRVIALGNWHVTIRGRARKLPIRIAVAMAGLLSLAPAQGVLADDTFLVAPTTIADEKAVFATIESINVVPARARIGGTVAQLAVKYGDHVERGQVVATVGDEKLIRQRSSLDAQIAGLEAQVAQAQIDLSRAERLFEHGTIPRARLDEARTAFNVATNAHRARIAERSVVEQQLTEGNVLAPTSGRVLRVPVTIGTVIMPGEPVAMVAEQNFVLRLRVPERHARFLKVGDPVRLDGEELGKTGPQFGTIRLVYPQIEDGRVVADAAVEGLGDYFVAARIRVWVSGGERTAFIIPSGFVTTRFGVDYVRVLGPDHSIVDVPVQRGRDLPRPDMPDGLEILSGLNPGDRLVQP